MAEPGRARGPAGCHPLAGDRGSARGSDPRPGRLAAGMLWPGAGDQPRGSSSPAPGQIQGWPSGHPCQVPGCSGLEDYICIAGAINDNCRGFIDQLGQVLPVCFWRYVKRKQSGDLGNFPAKWGGWGGVSSKIFMVRIT